MDLADFSKLVKPEIEKGLKTAIDTIDTNQFGELHHMLAYHMGWEGEGAGEKGQGKRIRPLVVLLATAAAGMDWKSALPAAVSVELVHNFSLIHDDIEDQSEYRHGRKTVWALWGKAQAINSGDCMFSLAFRSLTQAHGEPGNIIRSLELLQDTCVQLTEGQFLDMAYENSSDLPLESYWTMVGGKTASLLACSASIGAMLTGADSRTINALRSFAWNLGLAFQAQDDWLGVWGDSALTGKSTDSDLKSGKKSLPVLYGLRDSAKFRDLWKNQPFSEEDIPVLADLLIDAGVQSLVEEDTTRLTKMAKESLNDMSVINEYQKILIELADSLLGRRK